MTTETQPSRRFRIFLLALLLMVGGAKAQEGITIVSSSTDGVTPGAMTPGAPVGSYPLSGFENINPYNGGLNLAFTLMQVGGRGISYPMTLKVESKRWRVETLHINDMWGQSWWDSPSDDWWGSAIEAGYGPGVLVARHGAEYLQQCGENLEYANTYTSLTFTRGDGTEFEMHSTSEQGIGSCGCEPPLYRGREFATYDGTAARFLDDGGIQDAAWQGGDSASLEVYSHPSGYLSFRDGVVYRIDFGVVSYIRDRNGNRIDFTYDFQYRVSTIKDPLKRVISFSYANPPYTMYDTITFNGYGGATRTIRVTYASLSNALRTGYSLQTKAQLFPELNNSGSYYYNPLVVSSIRLPNSKYYYLRYNPYGEIAQVTLPTGGKYEYEHQAGVIGGYASGVIGNRPPTGGDYELFIYRRLSERRVFTEAGLEGKTTYGRSETQELFDPPGPVEVNHYPPSGSIPLSRQRHYYHQVDYGPANNMVHAMRPAYYSCFGPGKERVTKLYRFDEDTGAEILVKDIATTWVDAAGITPEQYPNWFANNPRVTLVQTTLPETNQVSKVEYDYDSYNNVTEKREFNFGTGTPGTLNRKTQFQYLFGGSYYNSTTHVYLRSLLTKQTVLPGVGSKVAETEYYYDDYTLHPLEARTNISQHETALFGTSYTVRGNPTSVRRWVRDRPGQDPELVTTRQKYDIAGNVVKSWDGKGYETQFDFSDRFGSPNKEARSNTPPSALGGQSSFAFATKIRNPIMHEEYFQRDFYTGAVVDAENANGRTTAFTYADALERLTRIDFPDPNIAWTTHTYYDSVPVSVTTTQKVTSSINKTREVVYDGLGRIQLEGNSNTSTTKDWVRYEYDAMGRKSRVSNPLTAGTRPSSWQFPKWVTTQYDGLDRPVQVITQDDQEVKTKYEGHLTTVTDQVNCSRRMTMDALGRLVAVREPDPVYGTLDASNYTDTSYAYNVLDLLTTVTQGITPVPQGVQTRTFNYDGMGRLTAATEPESGTTTYDLYDANSNLLQRTDPRGVINYYSGYDGLNRVGTISYSDGTPQVTFGYDSPWSSDPKGRLTGIWDATGSTGLHYDPMGRISTKTRVTLGVTLNQHYTYNQIGGEQQVYLPEVANSTFDYTFDHAGRQQTFSISGGFLNVVSGYSFVYDGYSGTETTNYSNATTETIQYNERLQPSERRLVGNLGTYLSLTYDFTSDGGGNNGNLFGIIDNLNSGRTQTFGYDYWNRLWYLRSTGLGNMDFGYDRYGNRLSQVGTGPAPSMNLSISPSTNRITSSGYGYDPLGGGNLTTVPGGRTFQYDAENRIKTVNNGSIASYSYEGEGMRSVKYSAAGTRIYFYDIHGNPVAESQNAQGSWLAGHGYLNGRHVFENTGSGLIWRHADHLGSAVVRTDPSGYKLCDSRYYPFGEEATAACTTDAYKFTGKERDNESGLLDYFGARYYSGPHGRFTSPDPLQIVALEDEALAGHLSDPQGWNKYAYVKNNPLTYIDPTGQHRVAANHPFVQDMAQAKREYDAARGLAKVWARIKLELAISAFIPSPVTASYQGARLAGSGKALEGAAQLLTELPPNTTRVLKGGAEGVAYRIPDLLGDSPYFGKILGEVKNKGVLALDSQMRDAFKAAERASSTLYLFVAENTQFTRPLIEKIGEKGARVYRYVNKKWIDVTEDVTKMLLKESEYH